MGILQLEAVLTALSQWNSPYFGKPRWFDDVALAATPLAANGAIADYCQDRFRQPLFDRDNETNHINARQY